MMASAAWTLGIIKAIQAIVDTTFIDILKLHLVINAVLAHNLDVVLFAILAQKEAEPACSNIFPPVLLVKPVQLGTVLLR